MKVSWGDEEPEALCSSGEDKMWPLDFCCSCPSCLFSIPIQDSCLHFLLSLKSLSPARTQGATESRVSIGEEKQRVLRRLRQEMSGVQGQPVSRNHARRWESEQTEAGGKKAKALP